MSWFGDVVFDKEGKVIGMGDYSLSELNEVQTEYIAGMQNVADRVFLESKRRLKEESVSTLQKIEDECYADALTYMKEVIDLDIGEAIVSFAQKNGINHEPVFPDNIEIDED